VAVSSSVVIRMTPRVKGRNIVNWSRKQRFWLEKRYFLFLIAVIKEAATYINLLNKIWARLSPNAARASAVGVFVSSKTSASTDDAKG
jgi:hypothetical protein